jgi:hypothetical protein
MRTRAKLPRKKGLPKPPMRRLTELMTRKGMRAKTPEDY